MNDASAVNLHNKPILIICNYDTGFSLLLRWRTRESLENKKQSREARKSARELGLQLRIGGAFAHAN